MMCGSGATKNNNCVILYFQLSVTLFLNLKGGA